MKLSQLLTVLACVLCPVLLVGVMSVLFTKEKLPSLSRPELLGDHGCFAWVVFALGLLRGLADVRHTGDGG